MNDALLRFFYKCDPNEFDDDEYCKRVIEMHYVLKYTGQTIGANQIDDLNKMNFLR